MSDTCDNWDDSPPVWPLNLSTKIEEVEKITNAEYEEEESAKDIIKEIIKNYKERVFWFNKLSCEEFIARVKNHPTLYSCWDHNDYEVDLDLTWLNELLKELYELKDERKGLDDIVQELLQLTNDVCNDIKYWHEYDKNIWKTEMSPLTTEFKIMMFSNNVKRLEYRMLQCWFREYPDENID